MACAISNETIALDRQTEANLVPFDFATLSSVTPSPNPKFQGREAELNKMHDSLSARDTSQHIVALWGLPGFGKTQLAIQYKLKYRGCYSFVLWADASFPGSIRESLCYLAKQVDGSARSADEEHELIMIAKKFLASPKSGDWLFVFDGYDSDYFDIREFLLVQDSSRGKYIITTIKEKIALSFDGCEVEVHGVADDIGAQILLSGMRLKSPQGNGRFFRR